VRARRYSPAFDHQGNGERSLGPGSRVSALRRTIPLGGGDGRSASPVGREDNIARGRIVALCDLSQHNLRNGAGFFGGQARSRLCCGGAYGETIRVANVMQMEYRMEYAFERHHPKKQDKAKGKHTAAMRHEGEEEYGYRNQDRCRRYLRPQTVPRARRTLDGPPRLALVQRSDASRGACSRPADRVVPGVRPRRPRKA